MNNNDAGNTKARKKIFTYLQVLLTAFKEKTFIFQM